MIVALILQAAAVAPAAWADAGETANPPADVQEAPVAAPTTSPEPPVAETGGEPVDAGVPQTPEDPAPTQQDPETGGAAPTDAAAPQGPESPAPQQQDAGGAGAEEGGSTQAADDMAVAAVPDEWPAGEYKGVITVGFALDKVTLGPGTVVSTSWRTGVPPAPAGPPQPTLPEVTATTPEVFSTWGTYSFASGSTGVATTVDYPILMQGLDTKLHARIAVELTTDRSLGREASCIIADADGIKQKSFNCSSSITEAPDQGGAVYSHATFALSLNRWVQTSGEIVTTTNSQQRAVSLANGTSTWNGVPYHTSLPLEIGSDSRVAFDDIVREGDVLDVDDYAKRVFSYQIVDGQDPVKMWVIGWSQNYRGASFRGASGCFITDQDPTNRDAPPLQELNRADVSGYFCDVTATGPVDSDRGHYSATFTVGRRVMETVDAASEDSRQRQKQILAAHCRASVVNCGLTFSKVTSAVVGGDDYLAGTGAITNRSNRAITEPVVVSTSDTSTFGFGQELDLSMETGWPELGEKFTATLKVSFSQTVSSTRTVAQTVPLTVPAKSVGWLTNAVAVIQTSGTIVIRDGERYWELTGAVANLIDTKSPRQFDSKSRALTPQELGDVGAEGPGAPGPGVLTPGTVVTVQPADAMGPSSEGRRLAATGAAGDQAMVVAAAGAGVLTLGALLILLRRRRHGSSH